MPSELYYYSGDCPDDAANKQIRENFIKMLKANPLFKEECGGTVPDCRAEFVSVKCGAISGRKRDANVNVKVEFNVILPYRENGQNTSVVVKSYETAFDRIKDAIDKAVQSKSLDVGVPGLELQDDSYAPGFPNFYCGKGMTPNYDTASCGKCLVFRCAIMEYCLISHFFKLVCRKGSQESNCPSYRPLLVEK